MSEGHETESHQTAGRVVQEPEVHDLLAEIETIIRDLDEPFVRVNVEAVSSDQWAADNALAKAVSDSDECLNCGEPLDEAGFCGIKCLQEWGSA